MKEIGILTIGFAAGLVAARVFAELNRKRKNETIKFDFVVSDMDGNFKLKGRKITMELREGYKQRVKAENFRTAKGNPANIEAGSARWVSSDETVATATADPNDENQVIIEGADGSANESATIDYFADGRPGEGVKEVRGAFAVTVTQGDVAFVDVNPVGTPFEGDEPTSSNPGTPGDPGTPTDPGTPADPGTPTDPSAPVVPDENPPTGDPEPGPANPADPDNG